MVVIATECILYGGFVVLLTAAWVFYLRNRSFTFLSYAMYFPGATALCWALISGQFMDFVTRASGLGQRFLKSACLLKCSPLHGYMAGCQPCCIPIIRSLVFSLISVAVVYVIVEGCVIVSRILGWAQKTPVRTSAIHKHNSNHVMGFSRAVGEELGWRCFLLPCLLQSYSPCVALAISGVMWGLFHVPVMVMLINLTKPDRPYVTVAVQSIACLFAAFTHGWVAIKSGFSLWPPSVMHAFWNIYNPIVLGSIYTNMPGKYSGQQWKINGEGLMGCIVTAPLVAAVLWELYNPIL